MFPLITCFHKSRILAVGRGIRGEKCWWGWGVLMGLLQGRQVAPLARPQHVHLAPGSSAYSTITWTKSSCTHRSYCTYWAVVYTGHAVRTYWAGVHKDYAVPIEQTQSVLCCKDWADVQYTQVILYCTYGAVYRGYAVHMEQVYRGYAVHMEQVYKGYAVHGMQVYTQVLQYILSSCTHRSYSTYYCKQVYSVHTGYSAHIEQVYTQDIQYI